MGHDVFISHAAADKAIADDMVVALELGGVNCWVAPRDIRPGDTWGGSIVKAIESSTIMVVIFSGNSNKSRQVLREVERAVQKDVVVLPFRLDEVEATGDMEYFLSATHWLEALGQDIQVHYKHLLSTTLSILKREAASPQNPIETYKTELTSVEVSEPEPKLDPEFASEPDEVEAQKPLNTKLKGASNTKNIKQSFDFDSSVNTESKAENKNSNEKKDVQNDGRKTPTFEFNNELETNSEMELANELDAEHAKVSSEEPAQLETHNVDSSAADEQKLAKSPDKEPNHEAPDLMLDTSFSRRETSSTQSSSKWPIAVIALLALGLGGWFYFSQYMTLMSSYVSRSNNAEKSSSPQQLNTVDKSKDNAAVTFSMDGRPLESLSPASSPLTKTTPNDSELSAGELTELKRQQEANAALQAEQEQRELAKTAQENELNLLIQNATGGDQKSQLELSKKYAQGEGVKRNQKTAAEWLTKAAQAGNPVAQYKLSERYQNGKGVYQNTDESISWVTRSAEQGNVLAQTALAERYSSGKGVTKNEATVLDWYIKAAKQGGLEAQKSLATIYEFGLGTNSDLIAALKWYSAAAKQGDMSSKLYLEKLLNKAPQLREFIDAEGPTSNSPDVTQ